MNLSFLIKSAIEFYLYLLLLRVWMQFAHADYYNAVAQFVMKFTEPVIKPLRGALTPTRNIDIASLLVAYLACVLYFFVLYRSLSLYLPLLLLFKTAGTLVLWFLIVRALMSWFSQEGHPLVQLLNQLTEPLLAPLRRIIPSLGGLDFSVMAAVFILYMLNRLALNLFGAEWAFLHTL